MPSNSFVSALADGGNTPGTHRLHVIGAGRGLELEEHCMSDTHFYFFDAVKSTGELQMLRRV
jgi:hypothetical protein